MPIMARDTRKPFTLAPEGVHVGVCVDVVDLGSIPTQYRDKHKVELHFQLHLPDRTRPVLVRKRYTLSLHEKANLRQDLESWRGRKFSRAELDGFDLETLVGLNGQVVIVHTVSTHGRTFAHITAIIPLGKGTAKISPLRGYVRAKDRPTSEGAAAENDGPSECTSDDDIPF